MNIISKIKNLVKKDRNMSTVESNKRAGIIKFFNETKMFGFIKDDKTGTEVFFHKSECPGFAKKGKKVLFNVKHNDRGDYASEIEVQD